MPEATSPATGTATDSTLSFDDGVDAISGLMLDPETDLDAKDEAHEAEDDATDPEESEGEGAEDEAAADETEEDDDQDDGPDEVGGGRFAADSAKVTLKDGTVISVQDLKRGFMSQQAFTRNSTEVANEKKQLAEHRQQLGNIAQSLVQQRDFLLQAAQQFLPKAPDRELMQTDPIGYMHAKAEYEDKMQLVNQLRHQQQSEHGRLTQEQQMSVQERRQQEAARLVEAIPEFRDQKVYGQFWGDAQQVMQEHYGYSPEELESIATDHRVYLVMRDLLELRKLKKLAPKVREDVKAKPKMLSQTRRMDPKSKTSREAQARREQLRKTGTLEAGIAALMDLDL